MHGRPRQPPRAMTPEELAKIEKYTKHKNTALAAYKKKIMNPATMAVTSSLLTINPDFYTLFNYRKEQVINSLCAPDADVFKIWSAEMELSANALKKQPKSYYAWYHRQWCINHAGAYINIADEMKLCTQFLNMDLRNFHCWNYRRYLAKIGMGARTPTPQSPAEQFAITDPEQRAKVESLYLPFTSEHLCCSPESELHYTTTKVAGDLSNYSAWHYRSQLLPLVLLRYVYGIAPDTYLLDNSVERLAELTHTDGHGKFYTPENPFSESARNSRSAASVSLAAAPYPLVSSPTALLSWLAQVLHNELAFVRMAYTMAPNDQSPWLFHRWLCGLVLQLSGAHQTPDNGDAGAEGDEAGTGTGTGAGAAGVLAGFTPFTRIPVDMRFAVLPRVADNGANNNTTTTTDTTATGKDAIAAGSGIGAIPGVGTGLSQPFTTEDVSGGTPLVALPALFAQLASRNAAFARAVVHVQCALLLWEAAYIKDELFALEKDSIGVLLALPIVGKAVDAVVRKAKALGVVSTTLTTDATTSFTNEDEQAGLEESGDAVVEQLGKLKDIIIPKSDFPDFSWVTSTDLTTVTSDSAVTHVATVSKLVSQCQTLSKAIADMDCLERLAVCDPMRAVFYQELAGSSSVRVEE